MAHKSVGGGSKSSSERELGFRGFRSVSRWTPHPMKCMWRDCKLELLCRSMLERHITKHCKDAPKGKRMCSWKTGCLSSPNTYRKVSDLVAHLNENHTPSLPWPCPFKDCSMVFNDEAALRGHFEQTHPTASRNDLRDSLKPSSIVIADPIRLPIHCPTYLLLGPEPLPANFTKTAQPSVKAINWHDLDSDNDATVVTKSTPMLIRSKANVDPKYTLPLVIGTPEPPHSFVSPVVLDPPKIGWGNLFEDLETNKYDWSGTRVDPSSPSSIVNRTSQLSWPPLRRRPSPEPPAPSPPPLLPPSAKLFIANRDIIIERHVPMPAPVSVPVSSLSPVPKAIDIAVAAAPATLTPKARPRVPPSPARLQAISRKRRRVDEGDADRGIELGHDDEDDVLMLMDDDIGTKPYTNEKLVSTQRARKSTGHSYRQIPPSPLQ